MQAWERAKSLSGQRKSLETSENTGNALGELEELREHCECSGNLGEQWKACRALVKLGELVRALRELGKIRE